MVLSVGQFRPEKGHTLQIRAFAALQRLLDQETGLNEKDVRLIVLGSCRNVDDERVLARVKALAAELGVADKVDFVVNCSFAELKEWLGRASIGLHTMWNEHFGIGVVEMMVSRPPNSIRTVHGTCSLTAASCQHRLAVSHCSWV